LKLHAQVAMQVIISMDQISIICTVLYNYKQLDIDGKIEVKDFRMKKGGLCDMIVTPLLQEITYKPPELLIILQTTMQIQRHM